MRSLAAALPAAFLAVVATACNTGPSVTIWQGLREYSHVEEREEHHALPFDAASGLRVEGAAGAVAVDAGEGPFELTATWRASARNQAEAEAVLARYRLEIVTDGDTVRVRAVGEPLAIDDDTHIAAHVTLHARVPAGSRVDVTGAHGDVALTGALGDATLRSSFGAIEVTGLRGALLARAGSGAVEAVDVEGPSVRLESGFGHIVARRVVSDRVEIDSGSGSVTVEHVRTGVVQVAADFGSVRVTDLEGALEARSGSGEVRIERMSGALTAESNFGAVAAEGVFSALELKSGSGSVAAAVARGSRTDASWRLSSEFGSVKLAVAEDFAGRLDASTNFGEVVYRLPQRIGEAELGKKSLRCSIGDGGGEVVLRSGSGSVHVTPLGG